MRRPALLVGLILAAAPVACKKSSAPAGPAATTTAAPAGKAPAGESTGLAATLKAGSQSVRSRAIPMAREMADQGQDPVPILLDALKDPTSGPLGGVHADRPTSTRETAVQALLALGPQGKKALLEGGGLKTLEGGLRDKKPEVREHTANAMGMVGPDARGFSESIAKLCFDPERDVRSCAYRTLERIKPFPPGPVLKLLVHPDLQIAGEAAAALQWLKPTGPEAVPPLLDALKRQPRAKQEPGDLTYIKNAAAEALAGVGRGAETAVPALVEMMTKARQEDVEAMVRPQKATDTGANLSGPVVAMRRIGKPAAEAVIPLLKHQQPLVRFQAAAVLSGMTPSEGNVALEAVQEAMGAERNLPNGELYAFEEMVAATLNLGGDAESVLTQLTELLKSDNEVVRFRSAKALTRLGRKAAPAAKKLTELLNDPVAQVQYAALEALAAIGPAARDSVIEIATKVSGEDVNLAREATQALRTFGPAAAPAVPALAKALDSNDQSLCADAAQALAAIGPEAVAAVEAIARHLGDANSRREERLALLKAAAAIGPPAREALPAITKLMGERDTSLRVVVADTLAKVGPGNPDVIKTLAAPLGDIRNNPTALQAAVLRALAGMGPAAKAAADDVKGYGEKANDPANKILAAATLVALGSDAEANAKVVLSALKDKDPNARPARAAAVEAVEFLGARGRAAVPDLLEVLQDRGQQAAVREKAARSLGKLGAQAKDAIQPLTALLRDPDKAVRRAAAEALGLMGPDAVVAAPKLRELVASDPDVAEAARTALDRIESPKKEP